MAGGSGRPGWPAERDVVSARLSAAVAVRPFGLWRRFKSASRERPPSMRPRDSVDKARERLEDRQRRERALELELDSYQRVERRP